MTTDTFHDDVDAAVGAAAQRFLAERYAFEDRQRMDAGKRRFDAAAWAAMAEMGWLSVATDEDDRGYGRRIGSVALLARHAGAANVNEPVLSTLVAAEVLGVHGDAQQRDRWLPSLMDGSLRAACALDATASVQAGRLNGSAEVVPDADVAELLLVRVQGRWHAIAANATGLRRTPVPLMDGRGAATLHFADCAVEPLRAGDGESPALLAGFVAAADALGAMETAFERTLDYVKTRKQFNVTLGSNQVVVHRVVDMYLRLEESRAVLAQATEALASGDPARAAEVHAAKAFIPPQGRLLAQEAVQLHGGIGITEEYAVSHCLRRILVDEQLFGSTREHLRRFAGQPIKR